MSSWDEEVDVIVAGTGCGGSSAALGAYYAGAQKVLLLEKSEKLFGGTTALAGGGWLWVPNNRFLKEVGVQQDPKEIMDLLINLAKESYEFFKDQEKIKEMKMDEGDLELMKVFAYEWPNIIETMQKERFIDLQIVDVRDKPEDETLTEKLLKQKVKENPEITKKIGVADNIDKLKKFMPSYCASHKLDFCPTGKVLSPSGGTTAGLLHKSVKRYKDAIELRMNTQIVDLIFADAKKNKVIGAIILDNKTKETKRVKAKHGVIFGTGGFSNSLSKKDKFFDSHKAKFYGTGAASTNTGDFIDICIKHDIDISGMDLGWFMQTVIPQSRKRFSGVFFLNADSFMVVNKHGKRYSNEKEFYQQRGLRMMADPEELQVVCHIYDERSAKLFAGPAKSLGGPIPLEGSDDDCTVSASSPEELTQKIKGLIQQYVPDKSFSLSQDFAANLRSELKRFNSFAIAGVDSDFHRGEDVAQVCWHTVRRDNKFPSKVMHPIEETKLKAFLMGLSTLDTKGGPRISPNGQIYKTFSISEENKRQIVEGLYGCGNCVRAWTQQSYPASGTTIASAICFGFKSGMHSMNPDTKF